MMWTGESRTPQARPALCLSAVTGSAPLLALCPETVTAGLLDLEPSRSPSRRRSPAPGMRMAPPTSRRNRRRPNFAHRGASGISLAPLWADVLRLTLPCVPSRPITAMRDRSHPCNAPYRAWGDALLEQQPRVGGQQERAQVLLRVVVAHHDAPVCDALLQHPLRGLAALLAGGAPTPRRTDGRSKSAGRRRLVFLDPTRHQQVPAEGRPPGKCRQKTQQTSQ